MSADCMGLRFASPVPVEKEKGKRRVAASPRARGREALFLPALLADAAFQLVALLVFARLAHLGPALLRPRHALLGPRLALRRVARLRAHLVAHAVASFGAFLALAGLARLLVRGLRLGKALFAGLRVLRLRAVEAPFGARFRRVGRGLGEKAGAGGEQEHGEQGSEHGSSLWLEEGSSYNVPLPAAADSKDVTLCFRRAA